jgi:hypothetical protein
VRGASSNGCPYRDKIEIAIGSLFMIIWGSTHRSLELINEYDPDKVASFGRELREVPERTTLELNLALDYFQEHFS